MKMMIGMDVMQATERRIRWCYENFDTVCCEWSGGKDSTVVIEIAAKIGAEYDRKPIVYWLDCEAEWNAVVSLARTLQNRDDLDFRWFQIPVRLYNSAAKQWFNCWSESESWMRDKEKTSIHDCKIRTHLFAEILLKLKHDYFGLNQISLTGVRADESLVRYISIMVSKVSAECFLSMIPSYKPQNITNEKKPVIPVIYDWNASDVWTAIEKYQWKYCTVYDSFYHLGISRQEMRVSSLCHEQAIQSKAGRHCAEIEPETWNKLVQRIPSINDNRHYVADSLYKAKKLPIVFRTWKEYRDYLLDNTINDKAHANRFKNRFLKDDAQFKGRDRKIITSLIRLHVQMLLRGDFEGESVKQRYMIIR